MDLSGICYEQAGVDLAIANNRIVELSLKISAVAKELQTLRAQLQVLHEKERDELRSSTAVATSTSGEGSLGGNVASGAAGIASRLSRRLVSSRGKRQEVLHWGIDEVCGGSPRLPGRHIVNLAGERRLTISGWAVPAICSLRSSEYRLSSSVELGSSSGRFLSRREGTLLTISNVRPCRDPASFSNWQHRICRRVSTQ